MGEQLFMLAGKKQTSRHLQTDNLRCCMGEGQLPFACPHQQGRVSSSVCGLGGAVGKMRSWGDVKKSCREPRRAGGHALCGKAEGNGLV